MGSGQPQRAAGEYSNTIGKCTESDVMTNTKGAPKMSSVHRNMANKREWLTFLIILKACTFCDANTVDL